MIIRPAPYDPACLPVLYHGTMEEIMPTLPAHSVNLILMDPPYGLQVQHAWDVSPALAEMWTELRRVLVPNGVIATTSVQPFTTQVIESNREMFKFSYVWMKTRAGNLMNSHNSPMRLHEDIPIFSHGSIANGGKMMMPYYPQGLQPSGKAHRNHYGHSGGTMHVPRPSHKDYVQEWTNWPGSILTFASVPHPVHPNQKPHDLFAYLIATFTKPGDLVLDPYLGAGTTCVAAFHTGRRSIGIEKEERYIRAARGAVADKLLTMSSVPFVGINNRT